MKRSMLTSVFSAVFWASVAFALPASAQTADQLISHKVKLESVDYLGKRAIKITETGEVANGEAYAVVKDAVFHNGEIEVELAGRPAGDAAAAAHGALLESLSVFRTTSSSTSICGRPTAAPMTRSAAITPHSTASHPDFSFAVARQQAPEKYESYVDLEPGVWTRYRITVEGTKARLYVNGTTQPCLIVNDLKLGDSSGGVALWIGPGTEGYFHWSQDHCCE